MAARGNAAISGEESVTTSERTGLANARSIKGPASEAGPVKRAARAARFYVAASCVWEAKTRDSRPKMSISNDILSSSSRVSIVASQPPKGPSITLT